MADQELFNGTPITVIDETENVALGKPGVEGSKVISWANLKALLATVFATLSGNQVISGIWTFLQSPNVPDPTDPLHIVNLRTLGTATKVFTSVVKTATDVSPASPWTYYYIDATTSPKVVKLPDPVADCTDEFFVALELDTHKVTITTVSGTALIGGATSQIIPNVGGKLKIRCNGLAGYEIILDTRLMRTREIITTDRDFTDGDGFEHNVDYICETDVAILITLPAPKAFSNSQNISSKFILKGSGSVTLSVLGGAALIGNAASQVISSNGASLEIIEGGNEYSTGQDSRPKSPLSSLTFYYLTEASTIPGYLRMVTSKNDPDYGAESFVDFTTSSTSFIPLVSRASEEIGANIQFSDTNLAIKAQIAKISGNNAEVYYEMYKRTSGGVETLLGTSSASIIALTTRQEINSSIALAPFQLEATDRIVIKAYGRKIGTGTDPIVRTYYEGEIPTRSILSLPASDVPHGSLEGRNALSSHDINAIDGSTFEVEPVVADSDEFVFKSATGWFKRTIETIRNYFIRSLAIPFSANPTFDVKGVWVQEMPLTGNTIPSLTNKRNGGTYYTFFVTDGVGGWSIAPDVSYGTKTDNSLDAVTSAVANAIYIYTIVVKSDGATYYTIESVGA